MRKLVNTILIKLLLLTLISAENPQMTVYNNNIALVRETREVNLEEGKDDFQIRNIPSSIKVNSVFLDFSGEEKPEILEMKYDYDLTGAKELLKKYRGQRITYKISGETEYQGTLLGVSQGKLITKNKKGEVILTSQNKIVSIELANYTQNVNRLPTLECKAKSPSSGSKQLQVNYITEDIDWGTEYNMILDKKGTDFALSGWASIKNNSGRDYQNIDLSLMAGQVEQNDSRNRKMAVMAQMASSSGQAEREKFANYYKYDIKREVDLPHNTRKQIALFDNIQAQLNKKYIFANSAFSEDESKLDIELLIENKPENNLGMPFPAGKIRLYKQGEGEKLRLIGRDNLVRTGKREDIELTIGKAYDIRGEKIILSRDKKKEEVTVKIQFKLYNDTDEKVDIEVREKHRGDWHVKDSNSEYERKSNSSLVFPLSLGAKESQKITYSFVRER